MNNHVNTIPPKRLTITQSFQEINIACSLIETFKETEWCGVFRFCFVFVFSLTKADRLPIQVSPTEVPVFQGLIFIFLYLKLLIYPVIVQFLDIGFYY